MFYGLKAQLNFGKLAPNFYAKMTYGNKVPSKQIRGIKNIHLNIRFLQNKMADIKLFVSQEKPHILGLSECEIRKTQGSFDENKLKLPGYRLLSPKSWSVQGKARVLVYVKSSLEIEQMDELEEISVQSIWFKAGFSNSKKIIFAHAYREHLSSLSSSLQQQKECLQKFLLQWEAASEIKIGSEEGEIHVMGDMNLDALKWLDKSYHLSCLSKLVHAACTLCGMTQLVKYPTRFEYNSVRDKTSSSCLDHMYTNRKHRCSEISVIPFGNSDHDAVSYI